MLTAEARAIRSGVTIWKSFHILALGVTIVGVTRAQDSAVPPCCARREALADAWWTGPMLANSAATLPPGHVLIEPYFYDVVAGRSNGYGSRAYVLVGLTHRLTVGFIPIVGFNTVSDGLSSSSVGVGDLTLLAQYGLTQFHTGSRTPAIGVMVQETFPTGKYDRLGDRPSDGFGSGAYTTTLALNSQTYFWLPNGRILRMRFDVSGAFSSNANVEDVSVYGTGAGFRGHAEPGSALFADAAWEYSLSRRWVMALDITYGHNANTRVIRNSVLDPSNASNPTNILLDSGSSDAFGLAPAIEYNWTANLGVLVGARVIPAGHRTTGTISPAIAINFVH